MRRPIGVTIIAILFLAAAVYLWVAGATLLVSRDVFPFTQTMLRRALRLTGPYPPLAMGTCYAVVGWGLFRLHNWARWVAMLVMMVGGATMLPLLFAEAVGYRRSAIWIGLQIVLRAVAAFYLLGDELRESFVRQ
jgi:hypothetical protein